MRAYLAAWRERDYAAMHTLLSPESQQFISIDQFAALHRSVLQKLSVQTLNSQLQSILIDGLAATATFRTEWQTVIFNRLETDHLMRLRFDPEPAQWVIGWQHNLILPVLDLGVSLLFEEAAPLRGNIYDVQAVALAKHDQAVTVGVVPQNLRDDGETLRILAALLSTDPVVMQEKIQQARSDWFVPLGDLSFDDSITHYDTLQGLVGVERRPYPIRSYPEDTLAAHTLGTMGPISPDKAASFQQQGYTGDELIGQTGLEAWGELFLAGRRGGRLIALSPAGQILEEVANAAPKPGGHIHLSLDHELQAMAEAALGDRLGSIVMMQPDGFIKALATNPRYSPNDFATGVDVETWQRLLQDASLPMLHRPLQGVYPPGSVFKIISLAAAMEHLGYTPEHSFTCRGTWAGLGSDFVKKCWLEQGHGAITLKDGLTQSCNVVFYEIGLALHRLDPEFLPAMARGFGLGTPTGVMGLDESAGVIPTDTWKRATFAEPLFNGDSVNMAIGQGFVLTTPLQIARMLAAIANGGTLYQPQVVQRISARDTGEQVFTPRAIGRLPVSDLTLATLRESLFDVAQSARGTTREVFADIAFSVAGKTGTAETNQEEPHAWFAGYTPAESPELVMVVMLENAGEGSAEAAPVFRGLAEAYFARHGNFPEQP